MTVRSVQSANELTAEQRELWTKLAAFPLDAEDAAQPFSARLAVENGWTADYAARVVTEYRRFLFLTATAGHVVCPSEDVDAVWHQHLVYSRSYWIELCRDTLGSPLHHDPTAGGSAEASKHWDMYRRTRDSYRRIFGEEPPRDIWPLTFERFDPRSQPRTINLRDHWLLRKPAWWPRGGGRRRMLAAAFVPMLAAGLGPLDWTGSQFLIFFAALYAVFLAGSIIFRRMQRDVPVTDDRELTAEEVACLNFGKPAVVSSAIAAMLHERQLVSIRQTGFFGTTNGAKVQFAPGTSAPSRTNAVAWGIYQAVQAKPQTLTELQQSLSFETDAVDERLRSAGYLLDASQLWSARVIPGLAMLGLLALGVVKVTIGFLRDRPIGFLIFGCLVVLITMIVMFATLRRSLGADRLLAALRARHSDLKSALKSQTCAGSQVSLAAALFGAAVLEGAMFADLKAAWQTASATNGGGSNGCGGSGCGGGCGGGGCGGGGCGGCGGG